MSSAAFAEDLPWVTDSMAVSTLEVISVSLGWEGVVRAVSICFRHTCMVGSVASSPVFQAAVLAGRSLVRSNQSAWPLAPVR